MNTEIPAFKDKIVTSINNWEDWLRVWNTTTDSDSLIGLLHNLFEEDEDLGIVYKLEFCLNIADGWSKPSRRKHISSKAMAVAMHYLAKESKKTMFYSKPLTSVWMLTTLSKFFRVENGEICNIPDSHRPGNVYHNTMHFLTFFCTYLCETLLLGRLNKQLTQHQVQIIQEAKPWLLEILNVLNRFDLLLLERKHIEDTVDKKGIHMDKKCIQTLVDISLRSEFPDNVRQVLQRNTPRTIAEAVLANSPAALFLIKYRYRQKAWRQAGI